MVLLTRISTSLRVPETDRSDPGQARLDEMLAGFRVVRSDAVLLAGMWAAVPTGRVSLQSYIADEVPTGLRGRLHSVRFVTSAVTPPLGPLAASAVLSAWSSATGLLCLAALSLLVTVCSTVGLRRKLDATSLHGP